ncbi:hypothetical protein [Paraburkholderia silvatlantica]|uniref:Uncharacterized protein n=1 Tax=Paraburkholderia silvatlantica TaxID=321895 RepID=A0ABR6G0R0_9BURK|nr:hypothetical protein [Paraburkholderia silvatlantica]MBB2932595.1 hypothetical protein [Paraburkholderia silvatlantica]PVY22278.1 hypothetical protein C7411_13372 [Paraburkholderia silvatlantica]PXW27085.1 hypothetical protein C7413_13472 [Paraburkholderia silvatlantica]
MKFSQNGLYVERYIKCANCGTLIYADDKHQQAQSVQRGGQLFCSQWCVDWREAREKREAEAEAAAR